MRDTMEEPLKYGERARWSKDRYVGPYHADVDESEGFMRGGCRKYDAYV